MRSSLSALRSFALLAVLGTSSIGFISGCGETGQDTSGGVIKEDPAETNARNTMIENAYAKEGAGGDTAAPKEEVPK